MSDLLSLLEVDGETVDDRPSEAAAAIEPKADTPRADKPVRKPRDRKKPGGQEPLIDTAPSAQSDGDGHPDIPAIRSETAADPATTDDAALDDPATNSGGDLEPPLSSAVASDANPTPAAISVGILEAHPSLTDPGDVRARAVSLLRLIDPGLTDLIPEALPFSPEDDPFTRTLEEWEAVWYASRESAFRVYLNLRVEFRRNLARAVSGEPNDLKPWTEWVFNGRRPEEGEPVHGLTEERRAELGWTRSGPASDFGIYREAAEIERTP